GEPGHQEIRTRLEAALIEHLYGDDLGWVKGGRLVGFEPGPFSPKPNRGLSGQRGVHYPLPPVERPGIVGMPG
ncbi:MAG TPA: arylsulfatase, partial [Candidatus Methylomirabilis sp.]|nr:arylsulfatase [Candidatus Methylomirabilis sp.]